MARAHPSHTTENTLTIQSTRELPAPSSEHRDPHAVTYECELTGDGEDGGTRELVALRSLHQPAGIDLNSGQRLPARFEAEITRQRRPGRRSRSRACGSAGWGRPGSPNGAWRRSPRSPSHVSPTRTPPQTKTNIHRLEVTLCTSTPQTKPPRSDCGV